MSKEIKKIFDLWDQVIEELSEEAASQNNMCDKNLVWAKAALCDDLFNRIIKELQKEV